MRATPMEMQKEYFQDELYSSAFQKSVLDFMATIQKDIVSRYLPPESTQRLRHGGQWEHPGLPEAVNGGIEQHSSVTEILFEEIVNHDLDLIYRFARKLEKDMESQFTSMMYSTVSTACEKTGNVVDAKAAGNMCDAFAEMLEKIEFCADRFGIVKLPEIHAGPEAASSLRNALENAPQEFKKRMEEIKTRKIAEALEREIKRKARFVRYGDKS